MRAVIVAFVSGAALAAVSAQADPFTLVPSAMEFGAAPPVELVFGGWGSGWLGTIGKIVGETCVGVAAFDSDSSDTAPAAKSA